MSLYYPLCSQIQFLAQNRKLFFLGCRTRIAKRKKFKMDKGDPRYVLSWRQQTYFLATRFILEHPKRLDKTCLDFHRFSPPPGPRPPPPRRPYWQQHYVREAAKSYFF